MHDLDKTMNKKLFVFDIDGTLLPIGDSSIPLSAVNAINALLKEGHAIAINSGRPYGGIKPFLDAFISGEKYVIAANGAALYDENGNVLSMETMPLTILHYFHKRFQGEGKDIYAYATTNRLYLYGPTVSTWANWEIKENHMEHYDDLNVEPLPLETKILKVMVCGPKEWIPVVPFMEEEKSQFHIVITGDEYLEILPAHVDKAHPIHELCSRLGIKESDVYAFGDSGNDIGMLKEYHGVAMGESTPEAKEAAEFFTKPSYEDGIAYALKNILKVIE